MNTSSLFALPVDPDDDLDPDEDEDLDEDGWDDEDEEGEDEEPGWQVVERVSKDDTSRFQANSRA